MYGSASVAEEVCHLNRWDQCSLPLNALETALELRQLDTVSFFLRNRGESLRTEPCHSAYNSNKAIYCSLITSIVNIINGYYLFRLIISAI